MTKKQVKKELIEVQPEAPKDILAAGAARQRKQEDAGAASAAFDEIEEVEEVQPEMKNKKVVTEAMKAHLASIRVKEKQRITRKSQTFEKCGTSA